MNPDGTLPESDMTSLKCQVRLITLLNSAEQAGLAPFPVLRLHTVAFLSNILAPIWDSDVMDGKIFKRRGGPFYPRLQRELDRLVGLGIARISNLGHSKDKQGQWHLEGAYRLNTTFANPILGSLQENAYELQVQQFVQELFYAVSALTDGELDKAVTEDATYSDDLVDYGNVLDFAEWQDKNFSVNAARHFGSAFPTGITCTSGEMLHLYIRHLKARLSSAK